MIVLETSEFVDIGTKLSIIYEGSAEMREVFIVRMCGKINIHHHRSNFRKDKTFNVDFTT